MTGKKKTNDRSRVAAWKIHEGIDEDPNCPEHRRQLAWVVDGDVGGRIGELSDVAVPIGVADSDRERVLARIVGLIKKARDLAAGSTRLADAVQDAESLAVNLAVVTLSSPDGCDKLGGYWWSTSKPPSPRKVVALANKYLGACAEKALGVADGFDRASAVMILPKDLRAVAKLIREAGLTKRVVALGVRVMAPGGVVKPWRP